MKQYSVFEKEMVTHYIVLHKCVTCVLFAISFILLTTSFYVTELLYLAGIVFFAAILLLIVFLKNKKKYGNRIVCNKDFLEIYDINNRFLYALSISDLCKTSRIVLFAGPRSGFIKKHCLILYNKQFFTDVYDEMEYNSYYTNRDILFIENPILITELNNIIN